MAIDLYRSRRNNFFKCNYWKRNVIGIQDNEELIHNITPSGIFYAKIVDSKMDTAQDIANVFRSGYEEMSIQTEDIVDIQHDDIVLFRGQLWFAERVNENVIEKNTQFSTKPSKQTTILIRKGK